MPKGNFGGVRPVREFGPKSRACERGGTLGHVN